MDKHMDNTFENNGHCDCGSAEWVKNDLFIKIGKYQEFRVISRKFSEAK